MNDFLVLMKQELVVTLIIFILLFIKVGSKEWKNEKLLNTVNVLLLLNFAAGCIGNAEGSLFNEMFIGNAITALEKNILNLGTFIISLQSYAWLKNHKHVAEFYMLLLSTLLGMFLMISSGNLLMFYLGLELSSIPLAALANFDLEQRRSSEAAFKYIISSAFSSGLLLFGISLVFGTTGTLVFSELSAALNGSPLQLFAFILLIAGFAFKISAVPFHLWTADVYEGAPASVTSYLSVISKGAVLFVFVSVLYKVFRPLAETWYHLLFVVSAATMIVGNLFAIRQNNLKRFLAFSSIAQVGFVLIGISGSSQTGSAAVVYFILIYVFSNLAAFGVVSLISALTNKETIDDYKALYKTNPLLSWALTIALFSLAGVPPTAGFFGKFFLLIAGTGKGLVLSYVWITIAALNLIVSFYYYLKIVKAIFMDSNTTPIQRLQIPAVSKLALFICLAGIVLTGLFSFVYEYIYSLSPVF
ncbi:MAG: NADH-quinone oxidoreductase subunit N [Bacteroidota bacterium]|nr:NADH-quinone oxidoreductase subunit N [Bacteroidota bacterium]